MATVAAVHDATMNLLGVLPIGGTIAAKDTTRMTRAYNEVYADLKKESLAIWASAGVVPDDFVPHLTSLMAVNAMDDYAVPAERYQRIVNKSKIAKREMRRLAIPDYESLDNPVDY